MQLQVQVRLPESEGFLFFVLEVAVLCQLLQATPAVVWVARHDESRN